MTLCNTKNNTDYNKESACMIETVDAISNDKSLSTLNRSGSNSIKSDFLQAVETNAILNIEPSNVIFETKDVYILSSKNCDTEVQSDTTQKFDSNMTLCSTKNNTHNNNDFACMIETVGVLSNDKNLSTSNRSSSNSMKSDFLQAVETNAILNIETLTVIFNTKDVCVWQTNFVILKYKVIKPKNYNNDSACTIEILDVLSNDENLSILNRSSSNSMKSDFIDSLQVVETNDLLNSETSNVIFRNTEDICNLSSNECDTKPCTTSQKLNTTLTKCDNITDGDFENYLLKDDFSNDENFNVFINNTNKLINGRNKTYINDNISNTTFVPIAESTVFGEKHLTSECGIKTNTFESDISFTSEENNDDSFHMSDCSKFEDTDKDKSENTHEYRTDTNNPERKKIIGIIRQTENFKYNGLVWFGAFMARRPMERQSVITKDLAISRLLKYAQGEDTSDTEESDKFDEDEDKNKYNPVNDSNTDLNLGKHLALKGKINYNSKTVQSEDECNTELDLNISNVLLSKKIKQSEWMSDEKNDMNSDTKKKKKKTIQTKKLPSFREINEIKTKYPVLKARTSAQIKLGYIIK
ncbi:protein PFC0760c-like [Pseudomyrmex gracilis]|uniref:protein PFC0760c-like n=1 Tax=Pseudomyrmex gracilis TaxID=219809 RepID=UPI000994D804|nr:protein PFC0760c-like [Pseudomyrmex gracilis]